MRDRLDAHGVDTEALTLDPHRPTPLTVVLTRGDDRAILTASGTLAATTADDVPPPCRPPPGTSTPPPTS